MQMKQNEHYFLMSKATATMSVIKIELKKMKVLEQNCWQNEEQTLKSTIRIRSQRKGNFVMRVFFSLFCLK